MRGHRAFGKAGGATGVEDRRDVGLREVFDDERIAVGQRLAGEEDEAGARVVEDIVDFGFGETRVDRDGDAAGIEFRIVAIAEAPLAAAGHVAELVHGSGIGAGAAERGQVGDDGVCRIHHRFKTPKDLQRGIAGGQVDGVVERIEPDHAVAFTDAALALANGQGIRQEHFGSCQIDSHCVTGGV